MSEKGSEPDIEPRRLNVAEVPIAAICPTAIAVETWRDRFECCRSGARNLTHNPFAADQPSGQIAL
jgi:hypothetical protein